MFTPGSKLGPYEILAVAGMGGMGEVYRARDTRLGRTVALKILPPHLSATPELRQRFEREAQAISNLTHPNICTLYDIGHQQGVDFLVLEFLDGETLATRISRGPLPPEQALEVGRQIGRALHAAHESGVIHRDLKLENIILTATGAKLLDFGIAFWNADRSAESIAPSAATQPKALTDAGAVLGTVQHMSPEQLEGRAIDARTDVFALGTVLYEMVSGKKAFSGPSTASVIAAILTGEPVSLRQLSPNVPTAFAKIVQRCLAKPPDLRFQSAKEVADSLDQIHEKRNLRFTFQWNSTSVRRIAILILIVLSAIVFLGRTQNKPAPGKTIAVLPFLNLSANPGDEYFSDGITEDVIAQISKVGDLKVISRTSVMQYKHTNKSLREIAKELSVANILEGSVQRSGDRVRIVGQLIDAERDQHLWAETYDRNMKDIFAIQSDVAQQIASALKAKLSPEEKQRIEKKPTENLAAYDFYLKGRESYFRLTNSEDNERAIGLFQKALELDPRFALAHAGLGDAYTTRVAYGMPLTWLNAAVSESRTAISLDPNLAEGYEALAYAMVFQGKFSQALAPAQTAVRLNPNYGRAAGVLGRIYMLTGKLDQSLPWMQRYAELNPISANAMKFMGIIMMKLGEFQKAEKWFQKSIETDPEYGESYGWLLLLYLEQDDWKNADEIGARIAKLPAEPGRHDVLGDLELQRGNYEKAIAYYEQVIQEGGLENFGNASRLAYAYLKTGKKELADETLDRAQEFDRKQIENGNEDGTLQIDLAEINTLRGNTAEALSRLQKAVDAGFIGYPSIGHAPPLESLRRNPDFQRIVASQQSAIAAMREK